MFLLTYVILFTREGGSGSSAGLSASSVCVCVGGGGVCIQGFAYSGCVYRGFAYRGSASGGACQQGRGRTDPLPLESEERAVCILLECFLALICGWRVSLIRLFCYSFLNVKPRAWLSNPLVS